MINRKQLSKTSLWQNQIKKKSRPESNNLFKENILAQFLLLNKCSLHEVLFEREAEITLTIPDLDNASEGRKNTRLRVTPELFFSMQLYLIFPSIVVATSNKTPLSINK